MESSPVPSYVLSYTSSTAVGDRTPGWAGPCSDLTGPLPSPGLGSLLPADNRLSQIRLSHFASKAALTSDGRGKEQLDSELPAGPGWAVVRAGGSHVCQYMCMGLGTRGGP